MGEKEFFKQLKALHLPIAYHHFEEGHSPSPPFMVYYSPQSENFGADNQVYHKGAQFILELYTRKKDLDVEGKIETFLTEQHLFFDKVETYIDTEQLYQVAFHFAF